MSPGAVIAILDANVLYVARLRDLFIRLAVAGLYQARWSSEILDECFTNLASDRPDIATAYLDRTRSLMAIAVPDALVTGYEHLIDKLDLPDPDDRHVVAAAITAGATAIVTSNRRDFPDERLAKHGLEAVPPDDFVHRLITEDIDAVAEVIERQASDLRNPPMSTAELLSGLAAVGLHRTVAALRAT